MKINCILVQSTRGKHADAAEADPARERRCPTSINRITECVMRKVVFMAVRVPVRLSLRRNLTDTARTSDLMIVAAAIKTPRRSLSTGLAAATGSGLNSRLLTPEGMFGSAPSYSGPSSERS
jgi:hypothetical protein